MPAGTVGDDCGMNLGGELSANFVEMQLHHGSVGAGENQPNGDIALWTEGAKDISVVIACVDGHGRTGSFWCPAMRASPFLTDAGFVLTPQFNGLCGMRGGQALQCGAEFF
jgi:hypothetical protein